MTTSDIDASAVDNIHIDIIEVPTIQFVIENKSIISYFGARVRNSCIGCGNDHIITINSLVTIIVHIQDTVIDTEHAAIDDVLEFKSSHVHTPGYEKKDIYGIFNFMDHGK